MFLSVNNNLNQNMILLKRWIPQEWDVKVHCLRNPCLMGDYNSPNDASNVSDLYEVFSSMTDNIVCDRNG